ncbi:MAG: XdhC family protein [Rhodospirillales bacterium]|nr:XdhC family protein [Rhodospirillales bacterium]
MTHTSKTFDLIESLRANGDDFCIATVVRTADLTSAKAGAKAVVTRDGEIHGFVGGGCVTGAVKKAALEAIRTGKPGVVRIRPKDQVKSPVDTDGSPLYKSSCPSGGTVEFFLEPMRTARKLVVCGCSPVAQALVSIAKTVGFNVILASLAKDHAEISGADHYLDGFGLEQLDIGPSDAIVISTQGKKDREALRAALCTSAGYVSMVGSRRKIDTLKNTLSGEGKISRERLADLHGPAGLDIGAVGPEEIALSIATEIVATLRRPDRLANDDQEAISC